ncbi:MAG: imidazolonepropionase [Elusimicrobiaceae bacterium]|jgi:imidazolonepropionase|nr:imidazolonepropionase [Elusimicrobiaceae bacterium]MBT3955150.1 imidazolonepropionase [Elusimicrobiaceae bacterium]MBT4008002.1 imidazolonepropionase [Elusimicrobiaceae bacterium]MBT4402911.1 imidazolonepropionase [Elusimicrobiaceae bacterium]MBT4439483.1 imidazolonepropionase [Elusimicrobiaceae bacterium]
MKKIDSLIINSSMLITPLGKTAKTGKDAGVLKQIKNGAVAINDGKILEVGTTEKLTKKYITEQTIDAKNGLIMPGFVDCHTHLVYGGSRENEMAKTLAGTPYLKILKDGGGIHSTVKKTREETSYELENSAMKRLDLMLAHGTTTAEIKTGYGLEPDTEKKLLKVIKALNAKSELDIVSTFLGAHIVPKDIPREQYIDWLCTTALTEFKDLAEFVDIFTEDNAYTLAETKKILQASKTAGYKIKIHAGQFNDLKASGFASDLGAVSIDHLEHISDSQLKTMSKNKTCAVLMPGVVYYLNTGKYADARKMLKLGVPVALATDFNPGSCPSFNMQFIISLACKEMKMTIEEAITSATLNSAYAIDRAKYIGSLEKGKQADIIILDIDNPWKIPYHFGGNLVTTVIKNGELI